MRAGGRKAPAPGTLPLVGSDALTGGPGGPWPPGLCYSDP